MLRMLDPINIPLSNEAMMDEDRIRVVIPTITGSIKRAITAEGTITIMDTAIIIKEGSRTTRTMGEAVAPTGERRGTMIGDGETVEVGVR